MCHIYVYTCNAVRTKLFVLMLKCQRPIYHYSIHLKNIVILALKKGRHQFSHKFLFWFLFCLSECKFTCASGKCLYLGSLICNQQNDCGDNSDEENCLLVTEHPPPGIFSCEYWFLVCIHVCMYVKCVCLPQKSVFLETSSAVWYQGSMRQRKKILFFSELAAICDKLSPRF